MSEINEEDIDFDELFSTLIFMFQHDGTIHIFGLTTGDARAEFNILDEVESEVKECLSYRSDGQKDEAIEMLTSLKTVLGNSLSKVDEALKCITENP